MSFERDRKSTSSQEDSGLIDLRALVASAPPGEFQEEPRSGTLPTLAALDAQGHAPPSSARFERSGVQSILPQDSLAPAAASPASPTRARSGPSPLVAVFVLGLGVASLAGALYLVFTHGGPASTKGATAAAAPRPPEVAFLAAPLAPLTKGDEPAAATSISSPKPRPQPPRPSPMKPAAKRSPAASSDELIAPDYAH